MLEAHWKLSKTALEILQVFKVAYFGLAVNWVFCKINFAVILQYLKALKKMYIPYFFYLALA